MWECDVKWKCKRSGKVREGIRGKTRNDSIIKKEGRMGIGIEGGVLV